MSSNPSTTTLTELDSKHLASQTTLATDAPSRTHPPLASTLSPPYEPYENLGGEDGANYNNKKKKKKRNKKKPATTEASGPATTLDNT